MNKLLVFLLISTMTCVVIEEPHELDDVPLEFSFKDIGDIIKETKERIENQVKNQTDKLKDKVKDQADKIKDEIKSIIKKLDGKNPFEEIKGHIKELEKAIKEIRVPVKELQKFFVDKPLEMFKQLNRKVQNGIHWLKVNGYWDPIMDAVKKVGKVAAISLCSVYLTPAICKPAITFVYEAYIKDL